MVAPPRRPPLFSEMAQHFIDILPELFGFAHNDAVAAKGISTKGIHILDQFGSHGIQMNVAHQLQEIAVLLAEDGFIAILKEMPAAAIAAVVASGVAGQQATHYRSDGNAAGAQQKLKMVGDQSSGKAAGIGFFNNSAQPVDKIVSVTIVGKDFTAFGTADDDVVQGTGCVQSGLTWHGGKLIRPAINRQVNKFRASP